MFGHTVGSVEMFVRVVRNVVFLWFGETGDILRPEIILRDTRTELFKSHKTRTVPRKPGRIGSLF